MGHRTSVWGWRGEDVPPSCLFVLELSTFEQITKAGGAGKDTSRYPVLLQAMEVCTAPTSWALLPHGLLLPGSLSLSSHPRRAGPPEVAAAATQGLGNQSSPCPGLSFGLTEDLVYNGLDRPNGGTRA